MSIKSSQGIKKVEEIVENRSNRVNELRVEGQKVIGYLCIYPVLEMMAALNLVPYRVFGDIREPITRAGAYLPTASCPFLQSLLDVGMKGRYNFLDGIVMTHICDIGSEMVDKWCAEVNTPFSHFIDTPHTVDLIAQNHLRDLLKDFQKELERLTGKELTPEKLKEAIVIYNKQRALVRELYFLRKSDPPLISGAETLKAIVAIMSLPVEEGIELLGEVIDEVKGRLNGPVKKSARLMMWGSIIDNSVFIEMIESLNANVVMDDTCVGSRAYFDDVNIDNEPLEALAYHYLVDIKCPRTFRESTAGETKKNYASDLESRFGYLKDYIREWKVDGVILQALRYCDTHAYEVPDIKDYLDSIGVPSMYLEHDYSGAALAPLMTRVQGFLEIIDANREVV